MMSSSHGGKEEKDKDKDKEKESKEDQDSGDLPPSPNPSDEAAVANVPSRPETSATSSSSHPGTVTSESLASLNLQLSPSQQTQQEIRNCPLDQDESGDVSGASSTKANVDLSRGSARFTSFDFSHEDEMEDDLFKDSQERFEVGATPSDLIDPSSKRKRTSEENVYADDNIEETASPSQKKTKTQEIVEAESEDDFFDISDEGKQKQKGEKEKSAAADPPAQQVTEIVELGTTDTSTPANDSSIIFLDDLSSDTNAKDSTKASALTSKPKVRAPVIAMSSIEDGSSNGMTQSATIFAKLTKKRDSTTSSPPPSSSSSSKTSSGAEAAAIASEQDDKTEKKQTTTDESETSAAAAHTEKDADIQFIADDEASMSFGKDKSSRPDSGLASRTGLEHLLTDSPDLSVSPIQHENVRKNDAAFRSVRKTSTPGTTPAASMKRSPKKRPLSSRPEELLSPSSDDDSGVQKSGKKKRKPSPKKKTHDEEDGKQQLDTTVPNVNETAKRSLEEFKVPETATEDYVYFVICGGPQGLSKQELSKIKNVLLPSETSLTEHRVTKDKAAEMFRQLHDSLDGSLEQHPRLISKKRISDVTSLSSNSRSSSTSTGGYLADGSGSSTVSSSNGSKRDRLSIMPELTVPKHSVISPLPRRFKRKNETAAIVQSLPLNDGSHATKEPLTNLEKCQSAPILEETAEQLKESQEKTKMNKNPENDGSDVNDPAYAAETQVDVPAYDLDTQESDHQPILASTPDMTSVSATKSEELEHDKAKHEEAKMERSKNSTSQSTKPGNNDEFFVYPDALVFAKFKEKTFVRYWPAKVLSLANEISQKWNVEFELDKFKSCIETCELIPADSLIPGHRVNVTLHGDDDGVTISGQLSSYPDLSQRNKISYAVKLDKIGGADADGIEDNKLVVYEDVVLDADMAKAIKSSLGGVWKESVMKSERSGRRTGADVDLDNLIDSKRRTRNSSVMGSPAPTPSKITPRSSNRRRKKGGENIETSAVETEAETPSKKGGGAITKKKLAVSAAGSNARRRVLSSTEEESETVPPKSSKRKYNRKTPAKLDEIFKDLTFILTQGLSPKMSSGNLMPESEMEESELDTTCEQPSSEPKFDKPSLKQTILKHGGKVLDYFPGVKEPIPSDLIILSDRSCRTMTYLLAITYGYRKISFQWIHDCISYKVKDPLNSKEVNINNYTLPIGYSTVADMEIELHETPDQTSLLKDKTLVLTSSEENFLADWKPLLTRLGASVCSPTARGKISKGWKKINLVIADGDHPDNVVSEAKKLGIVVVSTKWVIESLVKGEVVNTASYLV